MLGSCLGAISTTNQPARPQGGPERSVPVVSATVVAQYPHDRRAFTQGLVVADGMLYEGTGWFGESSLRRVDLATGTILQQVALPDNVFGEGIAAVGDRIVQLTWRSQFGYVYDRASFALIGTFNYPGEGWGLTYDGSLLIMSDGSANLRFLDPQTFAEVGQLTVRANGQPVQQLNELEYVDGILLANVWLTDRIAVIEPSTGEVRSWIDLTGLNSAQRSSDEVLNGIAYDADRGQLFVTGKRWPTLYEIRVELSGS